MRTVEFETGVPIKIWASEVDPDSLRQAVDIANLPFTYSHVALMPDAHVGYGMPIGGVLATVDGFIIPNAVGVDIGCGMTAVRTSLTGVDVDGLKRIMGRARLAIPMGFEHHKEPQLWDLFGSAPDIPIIQAELNAARRQLGTLGGGNHFIEIQGGSDGHIWFMIHSGSRNFGLNVANDYHRKALALREAQDITHPKDLAWLPWEPVGQEYFEAMQYCARFARANRAQMKDRLLGIFQDELNGSEEWWVDAAHNYAALEMHGYPLIVHRKGAIRARLGEYGVVPGSMGSPSYITTGLGSEESFASSSHGAGRRMGRGTARKTLKLEDEQQRMGSIVHGLRTAQDLDEAPSAYKDIEQVMAEQQDLTRIEVVLTPLANIKG